MTNTGEFEQEQESQQQEQEPKHPGWQSLPTVLNTTNELFEKCLFLLGYGFSSSIYVIIGDYLTIVDPGNDYTAFMDLFKLQLNPADIKKVVLTHGHHDHAMGTFELLRSYPSIIQGGGFELILHGATSRELKEEVKGFGCRVTELSGGETLELSGFEWEVIHTPGHTIHGICLYHAPSKTAFTGDTVLPHAMAEPDMRAGGRLDHYLFGIKALLKRDIENILPGHGSPVASAGRRVIEDTYEGLMMKIIGVETQIPWMQGATALVQKGLLEEAVFCCDKELALHPEGLRVLELKGSCLNDMGRNNEAVEVFDKILAQKSDHVFALTGKGCALMGLGRHEESLNYFDNALKIDPNIRDTQIYKGMALYLSGRHEEAMDIEHFRTEFMGRFKEELRKKTEPESMSP